MEVSSFGQLTILCIAMLLGAFGAGLVPLYATLNQKQLSIFNCIGTGMLLGTALAVIIPEGIHELFEQESHTQNTVHDHSEDEHGNFSEETIIGLALVSGFITMLLIDHLSCCGGMHGHSHSHSPLAYEDPELLPRRLSDLGMGGGNYSNDSRHNHGSLASNNHNCDNDNNNLDDNERSPAIALENPHEAAKKRSTVTIGLLVHAAADGIALGATKASRGAQDTGTFRSVELVVFFAIMMHKVPAAFALTVYLRSTRLDPGNIRKNLALFAFAAPLGALVTFLVLDGKFLGIGTLSTAMVSFCLLYSGGTFLYVALVHTFGELPRNQNGQLDKKQLLPLCLGCFIPVILSAGHEH